MVPGDISAVFAGTVVGRGAGVSEGDGAGIRLQKVLASHGVASRRAAERMIERGEVTVNGRRATVGQQIQPGVDTVAVQGTVLSDRKPRRYVALNKPVGVVTSRRSTHGERTVIDLLPRDLPLFPVGRLDKDTSGLLLLTNDGEWANRLLHPRYQVEREYSVVVRGRPADAALRRLRTGVVLPDGTVTAPARVRAAGVVDGEGVLQVVLREGKKRQIRLMCAAVGHPVQRLHRVRVGGIELGSLGEGEWRYLEPSEVSAADGAPKESLNERG